MMNAPQPAQEGSAKHLASVKEVSFDEAVSLIEAGVELNLLEFGSTKLVVLESSECGRYAVLTTASGHAARILLQ
ncbi:hypothetical protein [Cupriavidus campinensis]|uniref:Uncharacterized protein n=1 Tax=Cupriavidus campinensis TaxID=151783 RepID=A0ABY3ESN6_9BURK|nr:hypothetical protein [Cupriavidus campinensis]TSP13990.1 hypothetical protein FGG12_05835 [Cupriavidus campinensis]